MSEDAAVEHQATVDKGLKMKIKRKNLAAKAADQNKKSDEQCELSPSNTDLCEDVACKTSNISDKQLDLKNSPQQKSDETPKDVSSPKSSGKCGTANETVALPVAATKAKKKKAETRSSVDNLEPTAEMTEKTVGKQTKKSRLAKIAETVGKSPVKSVSQTNAELSSKSEADTSSDLDIKSVKLFSATSGKEKTKGKKESRKRSLQIAMTEQVQVDAEVKSVCLRLSPKEDIDQVNGKPITTDPEPTLPSSGSSPSTDPYEFVAPNDDRFSSIINSHIPVKKFKSDKSEMSPSASGEQRNVGTDAYSVGVMTDPECLGPCEPGTGVVLEGIVWSESNNGILVVNVTWRGKTYVGTLMDATRHHWGSPRFCDEATTTELEWRTPKGRRGSVTPASEASDGGRRLRKGRRGGGACGGSKGTWSNSARSSPVQPEAIGRRRGAGRCPDPDASQIKVSKQSTSSNDEDSSSRLGSACASSSSSSAEMFECSNENCNKKYKHASGLLYHQTHAHKKASSQSPCSSDSASGQTGVEGMELDASTGEMKSTEIGEKQLTSVDIVTPVKNGIVSGDVKLLSDSIIGAVASEGALTPVQSDGCNPASKSIDASQSQRTISSPFDALPVPISEKTVSGQTSSGGDNLSTLCFSDKLSAVTNDDKNCFKLVTEGSSKKLQSETKSLESLQKADSDAYVSSNKTSFNINTPVKLEARDKYSPASQKSQGHNKSEDSKNGVITKNDQTKIPLSSVVRSTEKSYDTSSNVKSELLSNKYSDNKASLRPDLESSMHPSVYANQMDMDYQRSLWMENIRAAQEFAARNAAVAAVGHPQFPPGMGGMSPSPYGYPTIDPTFHMQLMSTNMDYRDQYSRWMMTEQQRYRIAVESTASEMKPVDMSSKPSPNGTSASYDSQRGAMASGRDPKSMRPTSTHTTNSKKQNIDGRDRISSHGQNSAQKLTSDGKNSGPSLNHSDPLSRQNRPTGLDGIMRSSNSDVKSQESAKTLDHSGESSKKRDDSRVTETSAKGNSHLSNSQSNSSRPFSYSPNSHVTLKQSSPGGVLPVSLPNYASTMLPPASFFPGIPQLPNNSSAESSYQALLGYANSAYLNSPGSKLLDKPSPSSSTGKRPEGKADPSQPRAPSANRPSSGSGKDVSIGASPGERGSEAGRKEEGGKDNLANSSNPALTLRHLHTHHHTHVVGAPYPLYGTYAGLMPPVPATPPGITSTAFLPK